MFTLSPKNAALTELLYHFNPSHNSVYTNVHIGLDAEIQKNKTSNFEATHLNLPSAAKAEASASMSRRRPTTDLMLSHSVSTNK